jgi:hypothetical protein
VITGRQIRRKEIEKKEELDYGGWIVLNWT